MKIIYKDGTVAECPADEINHVIRHSTAHLMAQAIQRLYPDADFAYGPATERGFYYDVDLGDRESEELSRQLSAVEESLRRIEQDLTVTSTRIDELSKHNSTLNTLVDSRLSQFTTGNERNL